MNLSLTHSGRCRPYIHVYDVQKANSTASFPVLSSCIRSGSRIFIKSSTPAQSENINQSSSEFYFDVVNISKIETVGPGLVYQFQHLDSFNLTTVCFAVMWSHRSVVHSEDYAKPTTSLKARR